MLRYLARKSLPVWTTRVWSGHLASNPLSDYLWLFQRLSLSLVPPSEKGASVHRNCCGIHLGATRVGLVVIFMITLLWIFHLLYDILRVATTGWLQHSEVLNLKNLSLWRQTKSYPVCQFLCQQDAFQCRRILDVQAKSQLSRSPFQHRAHHLFQSKNHPLNITCINLHRGIY